MALSLPCSSSSNNRTGASDDKLLIGGVLPIVLYLRIADVILIAPLNFAYKVVKNILESIQSMEPSSHLAEPVHATVVGGIIAVIVFVVGAIVL